MIDEIIIELDDFVDIQMKSVREKLDFIDIMRTKYKIDFLSTKENIDNLILRSTKNVYLFFYSDELKTKHPDIYDKHTQFLIQLSNDSKGGAQNKIVIVDMDLHQQKNVKEIKIMRYENGQLESANYLANKLENDPTESKKTGIIRLTLI